MPEPRNIPDPLLRVFGAAKSKGAVRFGFDYLRQFELSAPYWEVEVSNGFQAGTAPFGYVYQIEPKNRSISTLRVFYVESFPVRTTNTSDVGGLGIACSASVTREIVAHGASIFTGNDIWSSVVTPIDESHAERVTIKILTSAEVKEDRWDDSLETFVRDTVTLVNLDTVPAPSTTIIAGGGTYTWYEHLKCKWYLKHVEVFTDAFNGGAGYETVENFYWPPVLKTVGNFWQTINGKACRNANDDDYCTAREPNTTIYPIKYCFGTEVKEAYNGECKCVITRSFASSASVGALVQMLPTAIQYDGIIQNYSVRPTLHPSLQIQEIVSNHPTILSAVRTDSFAATNEEDWPSTVTRAFAQPYKGGYIITTKVYHRPS